MTVHGVAGFAVKGVKLLGTDVRLTVFSRVSVHIERPIRGLIDRAAPAIAAPVDDGVVVAGMGQVADAYRFLEVAGQVAVDVFRRSVSRAPRRHCPSRSSR